MDIKNMTDEELTYYKSLSKSEKISYTLRHRSEEEKMLAEKKRQESRGQWTEEYKADVKKKISNSKSNISDEKRYTIITKFQNTMNSKSDEEIKEINRKKSEATTNYFKNLSEEQRQEFSQKMSDSYKNMTDEKKSERIKKGKETKIQKYGENYNTLTEESKEKLIQTNLDKYGVPYFCMTDKCRSAIGGNSKNSHPNTEFKNLLEANNIHYVCQEFNLDKYSYDFKIDEHTLIEINPSITHNSTISPFNSPKSKEYHKIKTDTAIKNHYRCISVWDWDNIDAIISLLSERKSIGARKCVVKELSKDESNKFLNQFHIQKQAKAQIYIGLCYNNELVSVMTFDKPRYNKNYEYELVRYCSSMNVIGGAEKIFTYFIKTYSPNSIISYCDLSKFSGNTYNKLGFKLKSVAIGKHWYNIKTKKHITDNLLRQKGFDKLLGDIYGCYGKGTSNEELMLKNGFVEIYDCGQATYIWEK